MQDLFQGNSEVITIIDLLVIPAIQKFSSHFKSTPQSQSGPHTLLGVDECHTLTVFQPSPGCDQYTMYDGFCSILHDLRKVKIFVIFLSTTSSLRSIAPSIGEQKSGRASNSEALNHLKQHAPYVSFPFDVYNGGPIIMENDMTLVQVCEVGFLCRFGRPL